MPLLHVTLTPNAFDAAGKAVLARELTEAAFRAESVPNLPGPRTRGLLLMNELPEGHCYSAGLPADAALRGVFITLEVSVGVLDAVRRARFASDIQEAAVKAAGDSDGRPVVTSAVIREVPEGQWAQGGRIMRLPEIAAIAGFEHMVPIAARRAG